MKKVLVVDHRNDRRNKLRKSLSELSGIQVEARSEIEKSDYESGKYDLALVHAGNKEGPYIEDGWLSPGTRVVIFSGTFSQEEAEADGIVYLSARYIEDSWNLQSFISRHAEK